MKRRSVFFLLLAILLLFSSCSPKEEYPRIGASSEKDSVQFYTVENADQLETYIKMGATDAITATITGKWITKTYELNIGTEAKPILQTVTIPYLPVRVERVLAGSAVSAGDEILIHFGGESIVTPQVSSAFKQGNAYLFIGLKIEPVDDKITFASGPHLTGYVTSEGTILPFSTDKVLEPFANYSIDKVQQTISPLFSTNAVTK